MLFDSPRAALAAAAARGADILPSLRLVLTAEALTAPAPLQAVELNAELDALCAAARELAACRCGWLYFCAADVSLPAAMPRGLLQGAVLTFLRGVLRSNGRAVVRPAATDGCRRAGFAGRRRTADARRPARAAAPLRGVCDRRARRAIHSGGAAAALPYPAAAGRSGRGRAGGG